MTNSVATRPARATRRAIGGSGALAGARRASTSPSRPAADKVAGWSAARRKLTRHERIIFGDPRLSWLVVSAPLHQVTTRKSDGSQRPYRLNATGMWQARTDFEWRSAASAGRAVKGRGCSARWCNGRQLAPAKWTEGDRPPIARALFCGVPEDSDTGADNVGTNVGRPLATSLTI